jgi:hypothetical protein
MSVISGNDVPVFNAELFFKKSDQVQLDFDVE